MATAFKTDVLTPTGELFAGEVERVSTRTVGGEIGILAHHEPVLARLVPGSLKLTLVGGEVKELVQFGGYLQIAGDGSVLLLVEQAWDKSESHPERVADIQRVTDERVASAEAGTPEGRKAATLKRHTDSAIASL